MLRPLYEKFLNVRRTLKINGATSEGEVIPTWTVPGIDANELALRITTLVESEVMKFVDQANKEMEACASVSAASVLHDIVFDRESPIKELNGLSNTFMEFDADGIYINAFEGETMVHITWAEMAERSFDFKQFGTFGLDKLDAARKKFNEALDVQREKLMRDIVNSRSAPSDYSEQ